MLLREGVKVNELAGYLSYLTCSTDMPPAIRHCFDGWTLMTLTSRRHATHLPETPPHRECLWDPRMVAQVRKVISGANSASEPIAEVDSSLSGADLDLVGIRRLLDPENCRSYTACIDRTAETARMWREYVYRFDVIPGLLSRSKYAQPEAGAYSGIGPL
jgi:hypothetical protein